MAERFLKIGVAKELFSEVYIRIDDEDPRFADCFNKANKFTGPYRLPPLTVEHAVEETLDEHEWEAEDSGWISTCGANEVPKEEATLYTTWDAVNDRVYKKEGA